MVQKPVTKPYYLSIYRPDCFIFATNLPGILSLLLYPKQALEQLEFEKIRHLLLQHCQTDLAREKMRNLRFHTRKEYLLRELWQTKEYQSTLGGGEAFPADFTQNISKELNLLGIPGAVLHGPELLSIRHLALCVQHILQWFKKHNGLYPHLELPAKDLHYEPFIAQTIRSVIDDNGLVPDHASPQLLQIRNEMVQQRVQLRKIFEGILRKLNRQGYLADIAESFINGRRTVAVFAEQKRIVKGILHGESDSGKTVFIEPEETIELNNELASLERAESREVHRILAAATESLAPYAPLLRTYYALTGTYDFIRAKALFAQDIHATLPHLVNHPVLHLQDAIHPLLLLHNRPLGKVTVPLQVSLNKDQRILIISGPNAGGKTVAMKTVGLLQLMLQAGLLVPVSEHSEMGIFKQIMVHIGDTQSIENELSTYSAHLQDMKYFAEFANGKTLFFIDELGGGTDPDLGGAFAEAIVERLLQKQATGIITTHYLNLKVMADKRPGIINGAMTFDEKELAPLYQLTTGKPGSSYTFAIAQRSGLPKDIIDRARQLTERGHIKLDKILHDTEQQSLRLDQKEQRLDQLIKQNEQLKRQYENLTDKEKLHQHYTTLKLQNKIRKEELDYLRETERKFKQIIMDWKKADNKQEVIQAAEKILFRRRQIEQNAAAARKADKKYTAVQKQPETGDLVRNRSNHQVGTLTGRKGNKAIVRIGHMPFTVDLKDWIPVVLKPE